MSDIFTIYTNIFVAAPVKLDYIELILQASLVVKLVMVVLIFFSVVSWGIIFFKWLMIHKALSQTVDFFDIFWQTKKLEVIFTSIGKLKSSPLTQLFKAGYNELNREDENDEKPSKEFGKENTMHSMLGDMDNVERALRRTTTAEVTHLESMVAFLATTGSSAPFIGLFGTVIGIMNSFHEIGAVGSASLSTVAPGIAEALIATAMGLLAAIPAVIAYNYFVSKIRLLDNEMQNFSNDFLNIIKKQCS